MKLFPCVEFPNSFILVHNFEYFVSVFVALIKRNPPKTPKYHYSLMDSI